MSERVRSGEDELRVSRRLAATHILGIGLLIGIVGATAFWIAERHNELARAASEQMVRGGVAAFRDKINLLVRDYSIWNEAYAAVEAEDRDWLYRNIGTGVVETGALDLIVVADGRGEPFGWDADSPPEGETGLLPRDVLDMTLGLLDDAPPASMEAREAFVRLNGELWALAVTRISPFDGPPAGLADAGIPRQIQGMRLDTRLIGALRETLMIDALRPAADPPPGWSAVALADGSGAVVGHVAWPPPEPGGLILKQIAAPLGLALALVVTLGALISRRVVRSARRLERSLVAARAADRAKTEFLSNVSHELRTPMNGVLGVVQLLELTGLDAEQQELVGVLSASSKAQMAIISDLIDFSQIESGSRRLDARPFEPQAVLGEVLAINRPTAEEKGLALSARLGAVEGLVVQGDERAFRQIITNLVANAVKFTRAGSVDVEARVEEESDGRFRLSVGVTDTGPGVCERDRARIFERFVRIENPLRDGPGGNGLGLAISRSLAELMGGRIELDSEPGRGSTFRLVAGFDRTEAVRPALRAA